jgi:hypothetical protein
VAGLMPEDWASSGGKAAAVRGARSRAMVRIGALQCSTAASWFSAGWELSRRGR